LTFATLHLERPQGKHKEAIPFLERAYPIMRKDMGDDDPYTVMVKTRLKWVRQHVREDETNQ